MLQQLVQEILNGPSLEVQKKLLELIQTNGLALEFIPENMLTLRMCQKALLQNGMALKFIPPTKFNEDLFNVLCWDAVSKAGSALQFVPIEMRSFELCLEAVQKDGNAIQWVPKHLFSIKLYSRLCNEAVTQTADALEFISFEMYSFDLCLTAVHKKGDALKYIPKDKFNADEYFKLCFFAAQNDGRVLSNPAFFNDPQLYFNLCVSVVQQNAGALQFIPEHLKADLIRKLTVEAIIANNYRAIRYFPTEPNFKREIDQVLSSAEYIVMNKSSDDREARDAQLVYAKRKENKKKKVISLLFDPEEKEAPNELNQLLNKLQEVNTKKLRLVLVGHVLHETAVLAGLDSTIGTKILETKPNVNRITLLGCHTARAKKPKTEIEMIHRLAQKRETKDELKYGLMTAFKASSDDPNLKQKCVQFCRNHHLDGVYVISKIDTNSENCQLLIFKNSSQTLVARDIYTLQKMSAVFEHCKSINFPSKINKVEYLRAHKNPLTLKELASLELLTFEGNRFDRTHATYQEDKETYPMLATLLAEPEDLDECLLKTWVDSIEANENITWAFRIKGATQFIHVNTETTEFVVAESYLYKSPYNKCNQYLMFPSASNINHEAWKQECSKKTLQMTTANMDGKTGARMLEVVLNDDPEKLARKRYPVN